jgi:DNA modification methylase
MNLVPDYLQLCTKKFTHYSNPGIWLFNCPVENFLELVPDETFDAIITDPPYEINFSDQYRYEEQNEEIFFALEEEWYRVLKKDSWFVFWWTIKRIPDISRFRKFTYKWQIISEFPSTVSKCFCGVRTYAPIFVYTKGEPKVKYRRQDKIYAEELPIVSGKIGLKDFKPTISWAQLLSIFTDENSWIFDPFAGFGGFALVCKLFGRKYVGTERDEVRFKVATAILEENRVVNLKAKLDELVYSNTKEKELF